MTETGVTGMSSADAEPAPSPPRRRRRRGHALRNTAIVVVVLAALLVAADRIALHFAQSEAAKKIKSTQGLSVDPSVSIKGFPFLTQVLGKKLDKVDVDLDGLTTTTPDGRTVRITELDAELREVKISGSFSSATAATASGSAHIGYPDLSTAAGAGITVGYAGKNDAGKGRVKVTGNLLGVTLSANATVTLVDGDTIRLHADSIPGGANVPRWEEEVRKRTDFEWTVDGLPSGMKLEKLQVTEDGIEASVGGQNVELTN